MGSVMDMGASAASADGMLAEERAAVVAYAKRMVRDGLVVGTSGNISVRVADLVAVTPSGVDYETMTTDDIPVVDLSGNVVQGALAPTTGAADAPHLLHRARRGRRRPHPWSKRHGRVPGL